MKILLLTSIAFLSISIKLYSQDMEGTYTNTWESNAGGALTYTITLNPDNTFEFVSYRVYESGHPSKTVKANGTWKRRHRLLKLSTADSTEASNLLKGLNKNKARFKTYSPRHRKYGIEKPSLRFYKSKVFYSRGMKLFKKEVDSVTTRS